MLTSDAEELSSKHLQYCLVEVAAGDSKMVEQILVNESDYVGTGKFQAIHTNLNIGTSGNER